MPDPIRCASCHAPTHTMYQTDEWQITRTITDRAPDGTCSKSIPFAAIACCAECAGSIIEREVRQRMMSNVPTPRGGSDDC